MRRCSVLLCIALIACVSANSAFAQYWFQSGARAGSSSAQNNGASVEITTVLPQNPTMGPMAFWVGESLGNGAFAQVGYIIENDSGLYPTNCTASGCSDRVALNKGEAEWFYEYFLPGDNDTFMGRLGPSNSVGANGAIHTYSFYSSGDTWSFALDGNVLGTAGLGTSSSGSNPPVAIAEIANTTVTGTYMNYVTFANLSAYKSGRFLLASSATGVVSYGVGSETSIKNPYGVKELGSRINYFAAGSGLPTSTNGTQLWSFGYSLRISSAYGGIGSNTAYVAYSSVGISAPQVVYINGSARANFTGWSGSGIGSYTGKSANASVDIDSDITETANYALQYYVRVVSPHPSYGSGWYTSGSDAVYGTDNSTYYMNATSRDVLSSWGNGTSSPSATAKVSGPAVFSANYVREYYVNATSQSGNVTGSGWYASGSAATITVKDPVVPLGSGERLAFTSWSNGSATRTLQAIVTSPISVRALFAKQYATSLVATDGNGNVIPASYFVINGIDVNATPYLQAGTYNVAGAYYKGLVVNTSMPITVSAPSQFSVRLPVYDVRIRTVDLFGMPVNAMVVLSFSNGTSVSAYSGSSGSLSISDVPYGFSVGTASFVFTEPVSTQDGTVSTVRFVSIVNAASFAAVMTVVIVALIVRGRGSARYAAAKAR